MRHLSFRPMVVRLLIFSFGLALNAACSSGPSSEQARAPEWTTKPTRTVDNGYIVYNGHGEGPTLEQAQFKAEGIALEDLANECSMIPKGSRIEDRYSEAAASGGYRAFAKVAVEFQTCDQATKTVDPEEIRKLANAPFTTELRKYQEFEETGAVPTSTEVAQVQPPSEIAAPPAQAMATSSTNSTQFYVVRQYVAYQKQIVILAPPGAYAPGSPQATQFTSTVQPAVTQVQTVAAANPSYKTNPTPWSAVPARPVMMRPTSLRPAGLTTAPRFAAPMHGPIGGAPPPAPAAAMAAPHAATAGAPPPGGPRPVAPYRSGGGGRRGGGGRGRGRRCNPNSGRC